VSEEALVHWGAVAPQKNRRLTTVTYHSCHLLMLNNCVGHVVVLREPQNNDRLLAEVNCCVRVEWNLVAD